MIDRSIINALSIGLFVFAWLHFAITNNPFVFYPLLAICCFLLYSANQLPVKYRDFNERVNLVGFLFTFNNLLDEFIFDPKKLQANELIFAILIIIFVIRGSGTKQRRKETGRIE